MPLPRDRKSGARSQQLVRQWRLLLKLSGRWWTLTELAEQLGVTYRTIHRDIAALEEVPFAIDREEGRYRLVGVPKLLDRGGNDSVGHKI